MSTNSTLSDYDFLRKTMLSETNNKHITENLRLQLALLQIVKCKESNIILHRIQR
jgi:hypothetical protein